MLGWGLRPQSAGGVTTVAAVGEGAESVEVGGGDVGTGEGVGLLELCGLGAVLEVQAERTTTRNKRAPIK